MPNAHASLDHRQMVIRQSQSQRAATATATVALVNTIMLAGTAAHGQSTTNAPTKLPDVVVQGEQEPAYNADTVSSPKYTEPLRDVPQTITVIPQSVIQDQGATTLRDILRNVSGISMQAGEAARRQPCHSWFQRALRHLRRWCARQRRLFA